MTPSSSSQSGMFSDGKWLLWASGLTAIVMLSFRFPELISGVLPGIDDMMRLQQVRDLLAGQDWFNVDQSRMLTPEGGEMHWSRLPDLFMASLIFLLSPIIGQSAAEGLAVGLWPLLLFASVLTLLCVVMSRLGVNLAGQLGGLFFFAGSAAIYNFWPGRIDHHGFVVVLVLGGLAALLSRNMTARSGVILAFCICAALTVALEALPYAAGLIAIAGLFWIVRGHLEGVRLAALGVSLMLFSTFFLVFDAPGIGARRMVCDAFGWSHWAALLVGGGLLTLLGVFGGWFDTWQKRLAAGMAAAVLTLAVFVAVNPSCFGDPYAAVPDSVRESWLNGVAEAKSLPYLIETEMDRVIWVYGFLAMASLAMLWMIVQATPKQRLGRIGTGLLLALAIAATVWQLRGQTFSHLFAIISAGWFVGVLFSKWRSQGGAGPLAVFAISALLLAPTTWRTLGSNISPPPEAGSEAETLSMDCIQPENFQAMAGLPIMRVHTPIDLGIPLMSRTPHAVFVGPYHRNVKGIERANMVLIGAPDEAHQRLLDMGATHLAYCRKLGETEQYAQKWPESFAAQMNQGEIPDWLEPVDGLTETEGVVRLYRVTSE